MPSAPDSSPAAASSPRPSALLIAGPPASGYLWRDVVRRWEGKVDATVLELFDPTPTDPSVEGMAARVADAIQRLPGPRALIAQGSALPIALRAAAIAKPEHLVLTNGALTALDPVLAALTRMCHAPRVAASTVLHPAFLPRWLASSAGLRRTVINPYVMDHDTVVALLDPLLTDHSRRVALARYLAALPAAVISPPRHEGKTLLYWGDADSLYPASQADDARRFLPHAEVRTLAGGAHYHVEERPWAFADEVERWLCETPTTT